MNEKEMELALNKAFGKKEMDKHRVSDTELFFRAVWNWIREMWFLFKVYLRLKMAIKLADIKFRINGIRYSVIADKHTGGLLVVSRKQIISYKNANIIDKGINVFGLNEITFYKTPLDRSGKESLSDSERNQLAKNYIKWQKALSPIFASANVGDKLTRKKVRYINGKKL